MQKCCVYKLKEGKSLNKFQEMFNEYVYVEDFGKNPLDDEIICAVYRYSRHRNTGRVQSDIKS